MSGRADEKVEVREGFVEVTGGKVWYRMAGAGRPGIPLLVLHGGPGAPHDYLESLAVLADERPVVFYDQLGCGNSERPEDVSLWNVERFVEELGQVRAALGLKQVHILGQSWGTMLATDYMLSGPEEPEGVISLIFSAPALSTARWARDTRELVAALPEDSRGAIEQSEATGDFAAESYQAAMLSFYRKHLCRLDPWPDSMQRTFEKMGTLVYETMWGPSEFTITGSLRGYDRVDRLKEITVPVLFTCGRHDEATPAATEYYHRHLPGSEMVVIEEAAHMHHLEKPEEYFKAVRAFLRRAETGS